MKLATKIVFSVIFVVTGAAAGGCHFTYSGTTGPEHWKEEYSQCAGKHQSPINIDSAHVIPRSFPPLILNGFNYSLGVATLSNNGHTAIMVLASDTKPTISGGPLNGNYSFAQLHFHWGSNDTCGGEDEIDGKTYPMEMHMVLYKTEYLNADAALAYPDGLCVLASLFELEDEDNDNFRGFNEVLPQIIEPGKSAQFTFTPTFLQLMPIDLSAYFTYYGSLTTPPCSEVVTWIDFKTPVRLSHNQFQLFRNLLNDARETLVNNFRAVQPLGDREVYYCSS